MYIYLMKDDTNKMAKKNNDNNYSKVIQMVHGA